MILRRISLAIALASMPAVLAQDAQVPRPAPEFAFQLPSGQQVLLSQYKGKGVILEFLLTTCPHCQRAAQVLSRLYKEYGQKGFQPVGVAINDEAREQLPEFIKQNGVNYPVGIGDRNQVGSFLQHSVMKRMMMPQVVMIDRKGVIQAQYSGDDTSFFGPGTGDEEKEKQIMDKNFREWIVKLLGKTSPPPRRKGR